MPADQQYPSFLVWLLIWCGAVGLVFGGIVLQGRNQRDPGLVLLQAGRIEAIEVSLDQPLAVYIASNPSSDLRFPLLDEFCLARSPDLTISPVERLNFFHVDGTNSWIRIGYLEVPRAGVYRLECIEHEGRPYAVAKAEPGASWVQSLTDLAIRGGAFVAFAMTLIGIGALWHHFKGVRRSREPDEPADVSLIR